MKQKKEQFKKLPFVIFVLCPGTGYRYTLLSIPAHIITLIAQCGGQHIWFESLVLVCLVQLNQMCSPLYWEMSVIIFAGIERSVGKLFRMYVHSISYYNCFHSV